MKYEFTHRWTFWYFRLQHEHLVLISDVAFIQKDIKWHIFREQFSHANWLKNWNFIYISRYKYIIAKYIAINFRDFPLVHTHLSHLVQVLFQIKMIKDVENNKITKTFQFKRHSNDNRPWFLFQVINEIWLHVFGKCQKLI